jgi:glycosyltransferase involved in cell wall biosynthesis
VTAHAPGVRAVHQFHSGTAHGDAITQQLIYLRNCLRELGYDSEIYAEHIPDSLAGEINLLSVYRPSSHDLLLVHHSIGHTAIDVLLGLNVPIVTIYHSITPPEFFEDAHIRYFLRHGEEQLRVLARHSVAGVADSNFNRREMHDAGFRTVSVMPVRTDFRAAHDARAARSDAASSDWLYVGRLVPNKRQVELVRAFAAFHWSFDRSAQLRLVGDLSVGGYVEAVRDEAALLGVEANVQVLGKLTDSALWSEYSNAGLFVSLSEHEGFGVPLLEAMGAGVPVVALSAAAVPETMGGAGVLLEEADPLLVAAIAQVVANDAELRDRIVSLQLDRLESIEGFDVAGFLTELIGVAAGTARPTTVQVQGPFETSYSLAILNRELGLHLADTGYDVSLYATEGPGDYRPSEDDLARHPAAAHLYAKHVDVPFPDVVIRQMYPPRVHDSPGGLTFQYFGWEESRLPQQYVNDFNAHLDGIGAMSEFVCDLLAGSGVNVPTVAVGVGVTPPDPTARIDAPALTALKGFRFLHISAAFPRKGVDVLLRAYFDAFSGGDDVSLILKTFPNPHNDVARLLDEARRDHRDPPDVRWIDRDLDRHEIDALYSLAHSYVHPARGEGFGLPVAEAMLADIPVISVAATGLADFVSDETAETIGFDVEPAATHLSVEGSTWVEPSVDDLRRALRSAFAGDDEPTRRRRAVAAKALIEQRYSWAAVAARFHALIQDRIERRPSIGVDMVTTWNSRCGIAEYSQSLVRALGRRVYVTPFSDRGVVPIDEIVEEAVHRCWDQGPTGSVDQLLDALRASDSAVLHVQVNFGFFGPDQLRRIVGAEIDRRPVVVTLHRTADLATPDRLYSLRDHVDALRAASAVVVHQDHDARYLDEIGVADNVHVIPIGCERPLSLDRLELRERYQVDGGYVIGTFGFLLPHKGVLQLVGALAKVRAAGIDARLILVCAIHPDPSSAAYEQLCLAEIERLGVGPFVTFVRDYLPVRRSQELLGACDVVVLPYSETGESSSAALRTVLPVGRPIVTTDLPIFGDARHVLRQVPAPADGDQLAAALLDLADDEDARSRLARAAADFCVAHSNSVVAARTRRLYELLTFDVRRATRADGSPQGTETERTPTPIDRVSVEPGMDAAGTQVGAPTNSSPHPES